MKPEVFRGDSAREFYARQACHKSGEALEITTSGPSIARLLLNLVGAGLVVLIFAEVFV